jgi:hypothetical protein
LIGMIVDCAREECGKEFSKTTHNQKYCTNECCRIETNRKIMAKYHERVAIRRGKKRTCSTCGTPLSRYNENDICGACVTNKRNANAGEAAAVLASVSWL